MSDPRGAPPTLSTDPREGTVTGPLGTVRLEPKVMGVLLHLAEHTGRVVSRDELFDAVWPGMVVTESTISRCIYLLRRALRDSGGDIATIETLPKRGYRLRTPVDVLVAEGASGGASTREHNASSQIEAPTPPRVAGADKSIAVLAFADMSPERDQEYFADGIAEELITGLSKLSDLRVIARTSSFRFKGSDEDITSIGRKLHVATVLEGSVRKAGNRIRLTAQLVDATNDSHLWSESYDRELGDIFDVQDDVARCVIEALKVE
ncbi:MAG: winged helix-turn-helix domain-containing protein, partial [Gammaproteobacteria bacterium]